MLVRLRSSAVLGVEAHVITIEVNITQGIRFFIVGLADNAIRESQQRIESALVNNGLLWPRFRVVINLAPANLRKEGSQYDLPIALGILAASGQLNTSKLGEVMAIGELSLDGQVRPVRGVLPMALLARELGYQWILVPYENAQEVCLVEDLQVVPLLSIMDAVKFLESKNGYIAQEIPEFIIRPERLIPRYPDFAEVHGQELAKRAMLIAAAGGHNLLMVGPPGSGKSMMARRLPGILPELTVDETLETTSIHSVAGMAAPDEVLVTSRPFRTPHHSISNIAMIGGGSHPRPGEISMAHHGILFLDELPEFKRHVLEVLRQPLEDRVIHVSRANYRVAYPADFLLVAAMNPCPCGFYGHPDKPCTCPPGLIRHYLGRISGPLLDRIDLQLEVKPVSIEEMSAPTPTMSSSEMRQSVEKARVFQARRYNKIDPTMVNGRLDPDLRRKFCELDGRGRETLNKAAKHFGYSARAYDRILKVARTIADLAQSKKIQFHHVSEAIHYRNLDWKASSGQGS